LFSKRTKQIAGYQPKVFPQTLLGMKVSQAEKNGQAFAGSHFVLFEENAVAKIFPQAILLPFKFM